MFVGGQAAWSPWPRGSWVCLGMAPDTPRQHFPGLSVPASPWVSHAGVPPSCRSPRVTQRQWLAGRTQPLPLCQPRCLRTEPEEGWGPRWPGHPGRCGRMMLHRQFPWQQRGPSAARCGLQKDPLAFPHWRHPHVSPPAPAAVSVLLPPTRDTVVPSRLPPQGQGPIAPLTPPCSPGKSEWVRTRGQCKGTSLASAPEASCPRVGLQGFTWPWPNFSWARGVSRVLGVFPGVEIPCPNG